MCTLFSGSSWKVLSKSALAASQSFRARCASPKCSYIFCQHFITMLKFVHSLGLHNIVAYRIYNINISSWTCNVSLLLLHCPLVLHFIIVYWFFTSSFSFLERITYINWYHQVHIRRYSIPKQESITEREHEQAKGRHFRRYHKILVREFRQQFQGICVRRFSSLQSS